MTRFDSSSVGMSSGYWNAQPLATPNPAARGEKEKCLEALRSMVTLPDDGLIPLGSLPAAIEDSPLLESLRDTAGFAEFRNEVGRRRAIMKRRVEVMREQLGLAAE